MAWLTSSAGADLFVCSCSPLLPNRGRPQKLRVNPRARCTLHTVETWLLRAVLTTLTVRLLLVC